jgi:hypothetical protein
MKTERVHRLHLPKWVGTAQLWLMLWIAGSTTGLALTKNETVAWIEFTFLLGGIIAYLAVYAIRAKILDRIKAEVRV